MLAFLPPIAGAPRGDGPPEPAPRDGGGTAAVLVSLIAFCALLAPVGWAALPRGSAAAARRVAGARVTPAAFLAPADDCASRQPPAAPPAEAPGPCFITLPR